MISWIPSGSHQVERLLLRLVLIIEVSILFPAWFIRHSIINAYDWTLRFLNLRQHLLRSIHLWRISQNCPWVRRIEFRKRQLISVFLILLFSLSYLQSTLKKVWSRVYLKFIHLLRLWSYWREFGSSFLYSLSRCLSFSNFWQS